jgi:hypothetical protein
MLKTDPWTVVRTRVPVSVAFGVKEIPTSLVEREMVLTPEADSAVVTRLGDPVFAAERRVVENV